MKTFMVVVLLLCSGLAWGYTDKDKAALDASTAKAKVDRDFIVKQECSKQVEKKDQLRCVKEVDEAYHRALKGWKEYHLKEKLQ